MKITKIIFTTGLVLLLSQHSVYAANGSEIKSGFCWQSLPIISWFIKPENNPCKQSTKVETSESLPSPSATPTITVPKDDTELPKELSTVGVQTANASTLLVSGSGISIQGNKIVNTGILSLLAGDGISVTDNLISNSDKGSSQYFYKTFHIPGQTDLVADSNGDTLEIAAGNGISLSTDPNNQKLTITNTGASGGWQASGEKVSLLDVNHDVVIGNSSALGKVSIVGNSNEKQLVVRGSSDQNTSLLELQNSSGTALATFNKNGALSIIENQGVTLTANNPVGTVSRLLTLKATTKYDRPWISHLDHTWRHVVTYGTLDTNNDETLHKRFELKTVGAAGGSQEQTLLTRLAIDYDRDLADIIFGQIDTYGVHNNYGDRIKMVHQMRDSGNTGSYVIGQWITELGAVDSTVMTIDPKTLNNSTAATLRFFRETNTSGQKRFVLHKGDGTSTETFFVNAGTGNIDTNANGEGLTMGDGTNTSSYINMQANRTMVGYDGSSAVLQGGTDKSLKLNVNSSSFGQGTALTILSDGKVGIGATNPQVKLEVNSNAEALRIGDGTNVSAYINMAGNRTMTGYDGSFAVLQAGTNKGIKLNVNNSSFGNGTAMTILSNGNVGIGTTNPTLGPLEMASGAHVTTGGSWENSSDRNLKENFTELNDDEILSKIMDLPITSWNYISEGQEVKHIGPVAQDFYQIFGLGKRDTSISTIDPAGIALAGIQALNKKIDRLSGNFSASSESSGSAGLVLSNVSETQSGIAEVPADNMGTFVEFNPTFASTPSVTANFYAENQEEIEPLFEQQLQFVITNVAKEGFSIVLNKKVTTPVSMSWTATASQ